MKEDKKVLSKKEYHKEYHKKYYKKNKAKIIAKQKKYYNENREKCIQDRRDYYDKSKEKRDAYYEKNLEHILRTRKEYRQTLEGCYTQYKGQAKSRGIPFKLTIEQFSELWNVRCIYCGGEIKTIGIDRIDSNLGYEIGNIVSCCIICNKMKLNHTVDNFIKQCKKIIKFYNQEL